MKRPFASACGAHPAGHAAPEKNDTAPIGIPSPVGGAPLLDAELLAEEALLDVALLDVALLPVLPLDALLVLVLALALAPPPAPAPDRPPVSSAQDASAQDASAAPTRSLVEPPTRSRRDTLMASRRPGSG
jgi:hypothetical protein